MIRRCWEDPGEDPATGSNRSFCFGWTDGWTDGNEEVNEVV